MTSPSWSKECLKSLRVHSHNNIIPTVIFPRVYDKYMYTQYLWRLNRVPMQESRLAFWVS